MRPYPPGSAPVAPPPAPTGTPRQFAARALRAYADELGSDEVLAVRRGVLRAEAARAVRALWATMRSTLADDSGEILVARAQIRRLEGTAAIPTETVRAWALSYEAAS